MNLVLVVDDEFGVAEVLQFILEEEGYRVLTAINGKQALATMAGEKPDVVILDFMMPLLDGPGVLAAMQADETLAGIPVIMMSSLDEATVARRCGPHRGFLRKPFRIEEVLAVVGRALQRPN